MCDFSKTDRSKIVLKTVNFSYVISHYQYGEADLNSRAQIDLMSFLTSEPAFDFLRTKNTLGYVCFSMAPTIHDYKGFSLIVGSQREKFTVEDVYTKMVEFHDHFIQKLKVQKVFNFLITKI